MVLPRDLGLVRGEFRRQLRDVNQHSGQKKVPLFAEAVIVGRTMAQDLTKRLLFGRPLQISVPCREILSCLSLFVGRIVGVF